MFLWCLLYMVTELVDTCRRFRNSGGRRIRVRPPNYKVLLPADDEYQERRQTA